MLSIAAVAGGEPPARPALEHAIEVHRVNRQATFFATTDEALDAGTCNRLEAHDVEVRLAGDAEGRVTKLVYDRRPLLVALLADISEFTGPPDYVGQLEPALRAAGSRLGEQDLVLIALFSDGLWVVSPPRRARDSAAWELPARRQASYSCGFWESRDDQALYQVLRILESRPERSALVYVGDGTRFMASTAATRPDDAAAVLATNDAVFSAIVRAPLPKCEICPNAAIKAVRSNLRRLAWLSGGRIVETGRVEGALSALLANLRNRAEVSYEVAVEPGEPAPRLLGLRVRRGIPCRAEIDRRRPEGDARVQPRAEIDTGPLRRIEPALARLGLVAEDSAPVVGRPGRLDLASPLFGDEGQGLEFYAADDPGWLLAVGPAVLLDSGVIGLVETYKGSGEATEALRQTQREEVRPVAVRLPSPETVRGSLPSLADGLLLLADEGVRSVRGQPGWPIVTSAFVVEGKTFLEWQGALSEAIVASRADWKRHAAAVREALVERRARRLIAESGEPADAAARARVREAVRARAEEERWWPSWRLFGGLLGDVGLQQVHREVDRRLAQRLLDAVARGRAPEGALADLEDRWERITSWLPPVSGVRAIVPLVPTWDAGQQRIGFWRVVLPLRDRRRGVHVPDDFAPEAPLALRIVARWIAEHPGSADDGLRVGRIDYEIDGPKRMTARAELRPATTGPPVRLEGTFRRKFSKKTGARITLETVTQVPDGDDSG